MANPEVENYEELCRLCASYDAIKMDIFSDKGKKRRLVDKITTCLPFEVCVEIPVTNYSVTSHC